MLLSSGIQRSFSAGVHAVRSDQAARDIRKKTELISDAAQRQKNGADRTPLKPPNTVMSSTRSRPHRRPRCAPLPASSASARRPRKNSTPRSRRSNRPRSKRLVRPAVLLGSRRKPSRSQRCRCAAPSEQVGARHADLPEPDRRRRGSVKRSAASHMRPVRLRTPPTPTLCSVISLHRGAIPPASARPASPPPTPRTKCALMTTPGTKVSSASHAFTAAAELRQAAALLDGVHDQVDAAMGASGRIAWRPPLQTLSLPAGGDRVPARTGRRRGAGHHRP